jgi:biotin carboxylase
MIGRNISLIKVLEDLDICVDIYLIEQKDLYEKNTKDSYKMKSIKKIGIANYHQNEEYIELVHEWSKIISFDMVVAGIEYSVPAGNNAAQLLGLPNLGKDVDKYLCNKINLRKLCCEKNIPSPSYSKVESIDDVYNFYNKYGTSILKPANRQGSVGVQKISDINKIEFSYKNTINAFEEKIKDRNVKWDYIIEKFLEGFEYSVETLVVDKKVIFNNITRKEVFSDDKFAEIGHVVPADFTKEQYETIIKIQNIFVDALEVENGVLHSEWKYTSDGPYLIECAGRIPGDRIPFLISYSYDFNFFKAYYQILAKESLEINVENEFVSMIKYFTPKKGVLKDIKNIKFLNHESVIEYKIDVKPGDIIKECEDSFSRCGYFIIKAENHEKLYILANEIENNVKFITE